jgi:DNA polymerase-3 subunit alpha
MRTMAGIVSSLQRKYTKRGDLMATFVFEDLSASIEAMVFPKTMQTVGPLLADDAIIAVKARLDRREDTPKLIVMDLTRPEIHLDSGPPVRLRLKAGGCTPARMGELRDILTRHPGDSPVFVHLAGVERETILRLDDDFNCDGSTNLYAELRMLFGADAAR